MSADRELALVAGLLYLVGMVAGALSVTPSVDSTNYLVKAAASGTRVRLAACFQFVMGAAYVGAAVALYPLLSEHSEGLALGFLGFRLVAGALVFVASIVLLLLVGLAEEHAVAPPAGCEQLEVTGGQLRRGRDLLNHVGMIVALSIGGLLLYSLLLVAQLIPRWLSIWGLVGVVMAVLASLLVMFGVREVRSRAYVGLTLPIAVQEAVLAIWLITNGLTP